MIGTTLSHYRLTAKLGEGGMGEVYLADDTKLERKVALKVLPAEVASDPDRLKRLQREAKALAALDHPNIVTVFSVEEDSGVHFLTMAWVEGEGLDELTPEEGFPVDQLLELAIPLTDALRAAHERGIVHRDLKPGNVMVDGENRLRVLDFGLARHEAMVGSEDVTQLATQTMTQAGTVMGTYPYMSPEQAQGQVADARSDLFSLGIMLYEMATGKRPFTGETGVSLISSIIKDVPVPVTELKRELPTALGTIIAKCLEKAPDDRFASAEEVRNRLHALQQEIRSGKVETDSARWRQIMAAALLVAMAGVSGWLVWTQKKPSSESVVSQEAGTRIASLAVLPLRNLSGDPEHSYFVDGMTEALITDLSKIGALTVIASSSVMPFKGSEVPLAEIAASLGVDAVVKGSVVREGGQVGISAQLIEGATERVLWGERHTRDLTSILSLQAEVAKAIAGSVQIALSPQEEALLAAERDVDPAAYDAVLKGIFHTQQFTPQDFDVALEYFEKALEIEPEYARAYVGMARVWSYRNQSGLVRPSEAAPLRRELLTRALEFDDSLAEAHLELAAFRTWYEYDWKRGEEAFVRAIELNPNYAEARIFYSHLLTIVGRAEEGTAQANRALRLDPLNPFFQALAGVQLWMAGRAEEGTARMRRVIEENPGFGFGYGVLWDNSYRKGDMDEAYEGFRLWYTVRGDQETVEALERGWGAGGYVGAMKEVAVLFERRSRLGTVEPTDFAQVNDHAGYSEKVIPWLEEAFKQRSPRLPYIESFTFSTGIRRDPRFKDLLRRMNLPGKSAEWPAEE